MGKHRHPHEPSGAGHYFFRRTDRPAPRPMPITFRSDEAAAELCRRLDELPHRPALDLRALPEKRRDT